MIRYLGKQVRVKRWVNNVCFQQAGQVVFGELPDTVVLDTDRCDGQDFGGCQMACPLLWKTKWLANENTSKKENGLDRQLRSVSNHIDAEQELLKIAEANVQSKQGGENYCCQATQLHEIASPRSKTDFRQYKNEINLNRVAVSSMASSFCSGMLSRIKGTNKGVVGRLAKTPTVDLQLNLGEVVRVKSKLEIVATLDTHGKNRGLWFDPVMLRYCGQTLKVSKRVNRIVDESSGRLVQMKTPSIVLDDLHCQPSDRRFCSRLLHLFWREIWLERISA